MEVETIEILIMHHLFLKNICHVQLKMHVQILDQFLNLINVLKGIRVIYVLNVIDHIIMQKRHFLMNV